MSRTARGGSGVGSDDGNNGGGEGTWGRSEAKALVGTKLPPRSTHFHGAAAAAAALVVDGQCPTANAPFRAKATTEFHVALVNYIDKLCRRHRLILEVTTTAKSTVLRN